MGLSRYFREPVVESERESRVDGPTWVREPRPGCVGRRTHDTEGEILDTHIIQGLKVYGEGRTQGVNLTRNFCGGPLE